MHQPFGGLLRSSCVIALTTLMGATVLPRDGLAAGGYSGYDKLSAKRQASGGSAVDLNVISACIYITIKHLPEAVGVTKGFFADQGLNVKLRADPDGAFNVLDTVAADDLSFGIVPPVAILAAIAKGADLKIVGRLHGSGATEGWWVVRAASPIHSPADLRGARIGITRPGYPSDVQSGLMVKMAGLNPATDIERLPFGTLPGVLRALDEGKVDVGLVAAVPADVGKIRSGHWRVIRRWGEGIPGWFDLAVVVNGNVARKHPQRVQGFFRAVSKAKAWIIENRDSEELMDVSMAMLDAQPAQREDVAYLLASLMAKDLDKVWDFNVPLEDLQAMAAAGVAAGQLQDLEIDWARVLDLRLLSSVTR
jgi:ABC-type nitrate/sulfonate/bicarbonate transport system substrate-binding protein